jgi:hypothetical protein
MVSSSTIRTARTRTLVLNRNRPIRAVFVWPHCLTFRRLRGWQGPSLTGDHGHLNIVCSVQSTQPHSQHSCATTPPRNFRSVVVGTRMATLGPMANLKEGDVEQECDHPERSGIGLFFGVPRRLLVHVHVCVRSICSDCAASCHLLSSSGQQLLAGWR